MYASISNHLLNFSRYIFAFVLVFGIFPYFIFAKQFHDSFEGVASRFIKMVFVIIIAGYILVITGLFEFLGILLVLFIIFAVVSLKRHGLPEVKRVTNSFSALIYNLADGIIRPKDIVKAIGGRIKALIRKLHRNIFNSAAGTTNIILIAATFVYSCYLRLYDAYYHAAPATSDGVVTLAWFKYIEERVLFHDGIYPQGFHICLAVIQKFSAADPVYILKYSGPLNGALIALGLYFVLSRLTGRKGPGIAAAFLYGVLGQYLTSEWMRQGATNSQEFAFVFIVPTLYFFYKYLENVDNKYLYTAFAGICITGLVHTLAFAFTAGGVIVILFTALIVDIKKYYKIFLRVLVLGIAAGVITVIPIGLGLLSGIGFHGSSADFLVGQTMDITKPVLKPTDYIAVASSVILYLYTLFSKKKRKELLMEKCFAIFGGFSFLLYYMGAYITNSTVLYTRTGDLWAIVSPLCIGMGVYVLGQAIPNIKAVKIWEAALCSALLLFTITYIKPSPALTYTMEYDEVAEQYLRIARDFRPTEWLMVSQSDDYALVFGIGIHMHIQNFLNGNNPEDKVISSVVDGKRSEIKDPDVFIFCEKKVFTTEFGNLQAEYERRRQENPALKDWIARYSKTHDNISTFFEDENIVVYQIHQPPTRDEVMDTIW